MNRISSAKWAKLIAIPAVLTLALGACSEDSGDDGDSASDNNSSSESESPEQTGGPTEDFTNDECANNATSKNILKVAGILPLTGNLAFLGPPEVAGVGLAVNDINAAGGNACHQIMDSGDATDASVANTSAQQAIRGKASIVVGAASSSVTLNIVDAITSAKIVEISPANTAVDLSGYDPFYFRTAPPDVIQGAALGNLILSDGYQKVAFVVFNDAYGTGLRDVVQQTVEDGGGEVVYGAKGEGQEFPPGQTSFSAEVSGALAENPDAIVVLAFDETKAIVPELQAQGWDMAKTYFTDGNASSYGDEFEPGTLEGAQGTLPGNDAGDEFRGRMNGWYESAEGEPLNDYSYGAESYDAVLLAALAAHKAGSTQGAAIQKEMAAVSGATDGEECSTYEDCVALLDEGKEIRYTGPSGIGPFDDENDPSSAFVGVFPYDGENNLGDPTMQEASK